jgi:hypothetical protein
MSSSVSQMAASAVTFSYSVGMSDLSRVQELLTEIRRLLADNPPQVQGAVLADLLATWLAGHTVLDSATMTDQWREEVLRFHLDTVRKLVPENAKSMGLPH